MNTYEQVKTMIEGWKGLTKTDIVVNVANACMGWSYVWGGAGQSCTPANRQAYADRTACPSGEKTEIVRKCQVLAAKRDSCEGCKWYPGGRTLFFDCRGFTRWVLSKVGINLQGAGATSQYNTDSNWVSKGLIKDMPADKVCCVFMKSGNTMSHTGLYIGNGQIIHCSGEVKRDTTSNAKWTHYGQPKGLDSVLVWRPTIRKGSTGDDVRYCQQKLNEFGANLEVDGKFGDKTKAAVIAFQKANGLTADGVVGPLTWQRLDVDAPAITYYTVTIPHLTKEQADALEKQYPDTKKEEEE